jgi:hypothetical protein
MLICQVKELRGFSEKRHGREGGMGDYFHFEFCFQRDFQIDGMNTYYFSTERPLNDCRLQAPRDNYSVLDSEINKIGDINV